VREPLIDTTYDESIVGAWGEMTVTAAILDTNILVQALISPLRSASARSLEAYYDGRYRLVYSAETLDELIDVLTLPQIQARHGLDDDEILEFVASLLADADGYAVDIELPNDITRDVTDTKFLALAEESGAEYLVTNDHRDLLRLHAWGHTRIVTPAQFLRELP
jgi:putative PIN family toxin of toxin-antitoxin system